MNLFSILNCVDKASSRLVYYTCSSRSYDMLKQSQIMSNLHEIQFKKKRKCKCCLSSKKKENCKFMGPVKIKNCGNSGHDERETKFPLSFWGNSRSAPCGDRI